MLDDGRLELHGVRLAVDVRPVGVAHEPVGAAVDPDREPEGLEQLDRRRDEVVGDRALLDHVEVGLDHETAVEPGERRTDRERLDEHLHPARRAPARHREVDPGVVQRVHRLDCDRGASDLSGRTSVPSTSERSSLIT